MPLCQQKRTLRSAIAQIFLAPFIFLGANLVASSPFLLLGLILMGWSMWMANEPLVNLIPTWNGLWLSGLVILFLMLAAIPLVIRDHFANGGYQMVWIKSAAAVEAGQQYAEWWQTGQLDALSAHFAPSLQADLPFRRGGQQVQQWIWEDDPPIQVLDVKEEKLAEEIAFDSQCDTEVSFCCLHRSSQISHGVMFLDSQNAYQIVDFFPQQISNAG